MSQVLPLLPRASGPLICRGRSLVLLICRGRSLICRGRLERTAAFACQGSHLLTLHLFGLMRHDPWLDAGRWMLGVAAQGQLFPMVLSASQ